MIPVAYVYQHVDGHIDWNTTVYGSEPPEVSYPGWVWVRVEIERGSKSVRPIDAG
jgi:hypothetical protein